MNFNQLNMLIALGREYGHAAIRDSGVSDTGHRICTFLHFHGEVSQDTVACALMLDKTTVAKAISAMEKKGLVTRAPDPRNRRRNILCITDAGRETIRDSVDIYDRWLDTVCGCLTAQEQCQLNAMHERLTAYALQLRHENAHKGENE